MRLRVKVLGLFVLLGVLPLLGLGAVEYIRSMRAIEVLLATQNARLAERAAANLSVRTKRMESDLLLLSDNEESQRWFRRGLADSAATAELQRFLDDAWVRLRGNYQELLVTDAAGQSLAASEVGGDGDDGLAPFVRTVRDDASGRALGTVQVRPRMSSLLRGEEMTPGFGERGQSAVIDRRSGAVLYHSAAVSMRADLTTVLGPTVAVSQLSAASGALQFVSGDTAYVAAFQEVSGAPWTVVMSAALPEFSEPFASVGRSTMLIFGGVAVLALLLFNTLVGRVTHSLEALTSAASLVGDGNFSPVLPRAGSDEVGRLSAAFASMVRRVRGMMDEIRTQRQMAVLGEFAAQLSHEVRNPLTAIKMNLQRIDRFLGSQPTPADASQSMTIALREVRRLDEVVSGVLQLARQSSDAREMRSLHELLTEVCEIVQDPCAAARVELRTDFAEGRDLLAVDQVRFKGAMLNLLNNALDAMPDGGRVSLVTRIDHGTWQLTMTDTGPGIAPDRRRSVFRPFETTKRVGTGLGLPLARRAIEEHGGTLELVDTVIDLATGTGATFVVRIPLAHS